MWIKFKGLIAATHTPMHPDGSLNLDIVPRQVEFLLKSGVNGLFVCGTTGEFPSLSIEERSSVAEAFVRAVRGRIPVIVHVGHNCLRDARALASHAAAIGADALACCPPSFFKPGDADVMLDCCAHVSAGAPDLPLFYYHIPALSGVRVPIAAFLDKAAQRLPSLVGVKYSCETLGEYITCLSRFEGRFVMMLGKDEMLLPALAAGASAFVGSTYNYAAPLYRRLWNAFENGDVETARLCQYRAVQFINLEVAYGGVRASKLFMKLVGVDCGPARLPLKPVSSQEEEALRNALTEGGFFEWRKGQ